MANESQLERFQKLKEQEAELKNQYIQLQTEAKLKKEEWDQALVEMKENYGVESFEDLREFRKQKFQENEKILKEYEEEIEKNRKIIEQALEKKNAVKNNLG
jgi:hypothetical protein